MVTSRHPPSGQVSADADSTEAIGLGQTDSRPLPPVVVRLTSLVIAVVPIALLSVASRLEPSRQGLGTHQQLGLPPCSLRVLVGIRCPACGMTTSWAHFTRGQWRQSAWVNKGGFLLALLSPIVAFLALRTFWNARLPSTAMWRIVVFALVGIVIVTFLDWMMLLVAL